MAEAAGQPLNPRIQTLLESQAVSRRAQEDPSGLACFRDPLHHAP